MLHKYIWIRNQRCLTPTILSPSIKASVHPPHPSGLLQHVQVCSMKVQVMRGWSLGREKPPRRGIHIGGGIGGDSGVHGGRGIKRYGLHGQNSHFISVYFWWLNKLLTTSLGVWCRRCFEIHLYIHSFPLPLILYRAPSRMLVISKQYQRETVIQNSAVHPDSREG